MSVLLKTKCHQSLSVHDESAPLYKITLNGVALVTSVLTQPLSIWTTGDTNLLLALKTSKVLAQCIHLQD